MVRFVADSNLLGRRRRMSRGHALHGDTSEWRRHALSLPAGVRGDASQGDVGGPLDVFGIVHGYPTAPVTWRALWRVRDERPLRRLPGPSLRYGRRFDGRRSALHPYAWKVRWIPPAHVARRCH